ncbi:hypothetical protein FB45DRAFT_1043719 [Roridomyces roridus]|uniref:Wax synthase domain-containing protein n=1 Tax=Roridomyces roridus TaxID=1738132 RepID=A0AAD7AZ88_9AGAR|nr:hypothetical protein FB45DRAFT_1043719 [Roridomyces roridus]
MLGLQHGSTCALCVEIVVAFLLSGFVHYLGELIPLRAAGEQSGSIVFFGIQPVGIALETLVVRSSLGAACRRNLSKEARTAFGCVWVLSWFVVTLPIMQDPIIRTGELESRVNFSVIMWMWNGTWELPQRM